MRELLEIFLKDEGHQAATASDGATALTLVARGEIRPDIILADYNLPNGMNGLEVAARLQESLGYKVPAIVLTGDTSTGTLRQIALGSSVRLSKPVKLTELTDVTQRLLAISQAAGAKRAPLSPEPGGGPASPIIFIVDDDSHIREGLREMLEESGRIVEDFATCEAFFSAYHPGREACLILDAYLPGMDGLELLRRLRVVGHKLPTIMITGNSDVPMAIRAMKAGAVDFIEKPIHRKELLDQRPKGARAIAGFKQGIRVAGGCGKSPRGPHHAPAADHGDGPGRPSQQEHRSGSWDQPTDCREPSGIDHEEVGIEVASGAGSAGDCRNRKRRRLAGCRARTRGRAHP